MDGVNKTLYIPLYGKSLVSKKGILLRDPMAEEIWQREGFALKGKSASKWLAYNMGMRAAVFDRWTREKMARNRHAPVLHIGCGLDSRCLRIGAGRQWYDVDFPEVIRERERYFRESETYHMVSADMRENGWKQRIPSGGPAIVVMEGVSMYFQPEELEDLLRELGNHFSGLTLLMDVYTPFAAKASRYKNPINDVGVTQVYGVEDPGKLAQRTQWSYVREHSLTPPDMIAQLAASERVVFSNLFAGKFAKKIYRLYEFERKEIRHL